MIFGISDWLFYYMVAQYVGMGVFGLWFLYNARLKIGFKADFYRKSSRAGENDEYGQVYGGYRIYDDKKNGILDMNGEKVSIISYVGGGIGAGEYVWIGAKEFKKDADVISYGKRSFFVDFSFPYRRRYGFTDYAYDFETGSHLSFGGEVKGAEPKKVERHLMSGVFARLLNSAKDMNKPMVIMFVVMMIMVGVVAGVAGWFGGSGSVGNRTIVTNILLGVV